MRELKQTGFADRLTAQAEAKKALLARFKAKPAAPDPEFDKLAEKRAAEKAEQRRVHELAKAEQRRAKAEQQAAVIESQRQSAEELEDQRRNERRERKAAIKAEQRMRRAEKKSRR